MYRQLYMGGGEGIASLDAGAPSIKYTGDIKPQMASAPDPMAELYNIFLDLKQKGQIPKEMGFEQFKQLMEEQTSMPAQQPMMAANGGRMHYGLGSIFKGVKKAVKGVGEGIGKLVKSDIGKAALLYAGTAGLGSLGAGGGFGSLFKLGTYAPSTVLANLGTTATRFNPFSKGIPSVAKGIDKTVNKGLGKGMDLAALLAITGGGLAAGSLTQQPDESTEQYKARVQALTPQLRKNWQSLNPIQESETPEEYQAREDAFVLRATGEYGTSFNTGGRVKYAKGTDRDQQTMELKDVDPNLRAGPDWYIKRIEALMYEYDMDYDTAAEIAFDSDKYFELMPDGLAKGGRPGYALGDTAQMAAGIEGLPFRQNQAGVGEIDMRETGGFIPPVGIKEKADDIPAMLSNNEFVFTADAVRGMGGGNVELGSQRMYDMMKRLEKGGRV
jgi:hypothetical protein